MDEVKKLDNHSVSGWFVCLFVFHYFVLYVYMFLCAGLGYTYTCVDMEATEHNVRCLPQLFSTSVWRQGLSLNVELTSVLSCEP